MDFKKLFFYLLVSLLAFNLACAQDQISLLKGKIKNDSTDEYMSSVHVLNLNSVEGVISDRQGNFEIAVKSKDTLWSKFVLMLGIQMKTGLDPKIIVSIKK